MENYFSQKLQLLKEKDKRAYASFEQALCMGKAVKGDQLLELNKICKAIYVLQSGVVRHFGLDGYGRQFNTWFSFEGEIVVAMESFVLQKPSMEGIEVLENCEYIFLKHTDVARLTDEYHAIETFYRQLLELYYIEVEQRLYRMQIFSAKQKYDYLLHNKPQFLRRLPQNHIASFLGITKETLCRIRNSK